MSNNIKQDSAQSDVALLQLITGKFVTMAVATAAKLGIADLLARGPSTSESIARTAGLHPVALDRLMRALSGIGILTLDDDGRFALTEVGSLLRSDVEGSLRDFAIYMGEDFHSRAWSNLPYSVTTGKAAFDKTHGANAWEYFAKDHRAGATFSAAMTSFTSAIAYAVVAAYDFTGITRLVDVGGGHGHLIASVLAANPDINGVLLELPAVADGARKSVATKGLSERIEVVMGDFFVKVPAAGDAYLLKHILHDWDDDRAVRILKACRVGMAAGGRVLVLEMLLPPGTEPTFARLIDLEMLVMTTGGRERTQGEFESLFERAGLVLRRIVPTASPVVILEAVVAPLP